MHRDGRYGLMRSYRVLRVPKRDTRNAVLRSGALYANCARTRFTIDAGVDAAWTSMMSFLRGPKINLRRQINNFLMAFMWRISRASRTGHGTNERIIDTTVVGVQTSKRPRRPVQNLTEQQHSIPIDDDRSDV